MLSQEYNKPCQLICYYSIYIFAGHFCKQAIDGWQWTSLADHLEKHRSRPYWGSLPVCCQWCLVLGFTTFRCYRVPPFMITVTHTLHNMWQLSDVFIFTNPLCLAKVQSLTSNPERHISRIQEHLTIDSLCYDPKYCSVSYEQFTHSCVRCTLDFLPWWLYFLPCLIQTTPLGIIMCTAWALVKRSSGVHTRSVFWLPHVHLVETSGQQTRVLGVVGQWVYGLLCVVCQLLHNFRL